MKRVLVMGIGICLAGIFQACNSNEKDSTTIAEDEKLAVDTNATRMSDNKISGMSNKTVAGDEFLSKAYDGGLMEVELGEYAARNASNKDVKAYGSLLAKDHARANDEMKKLAGEQGIALPDKMGEEHMMHVKELESKKGADFDKAYINMMVDDHVKDVSKFKEVSGSADVADPIKSFAAKTLPVLETHLDKAKTLQPKL